MGVGRSLKLKKKSIFFNLHKYSDTLKKYILKTEFQSLESLLATSLSFGFLSYDFIQVENMLE